MRIAWDLDHSLAIHHGYAESIFTPLRRSLLQMTEALAAFGKVGWGADLLDAGCGLGGPAFWLAEKRQCQVWGITINPREQERAGHQARAKGLHSQTQFRVEDFTATSFPDASFDVVWALESVVHALDRPAFCREAFRLLRPGGRFLVGDLFAREEPFSPREAPMVRRWLDPVCVEHLPTLAAFREMLTAAGFQHLRDLDITDKVWPSVWRQYYGSFALRLMTWYFRTFWPGHPTYEERPYRYPYWQYHTYRMGFWHYALLSSEKPMS